MTNKLRLHRILLGFAMVLLTGTILTNCSKNEAASPQTQEQKLTREEYIKQAKKDAQRVRNPNARYESNYYIEYDLTVDAMYYDSTTENSYDLFYTPVYQDDTRAKYVGSLVGYVLQDHRVFNVLYLTEGENSPGVTEVDVRWLGGNDLGTFTVKDNEVIGKTLATSSGDSYAEAQRSWWSCTTDCTGDAHIACQSSTECTVLLIGTNIGGNFVRPRVGGAGSASITVACAVACAFNSNLDLLPQY